MLNKRLEFVISSRDSTIIFNIIFVLLLAEVNPIPEKQVDKMDMLGTSSIGHIKMILALSINVVALYMTAIIVNIRVSSLTSCILESGVGFAIILAFNA